MCDCIAEVNARLAQDGGEVLTDMLTEPPRAFITTYRRWARRKLPLVQATFCPFCGTVYPPNENAAAKRRYAANTTKARASSRATPST